MRVVVVGGGPAGLYFALLAKKRLNAASVEVYERNPKGATYGFGIVLADRGLTRLALADPNSYAEIAAASFVSRHRIVEHRGERIFIEGGGYGGAISRLRLLEILEAHCVRAGVEIHHDAEIGDIGRFDGADLVVGADGVNSAVRQAHAAGFGVTNWTLTNRIAWYGTTQHFHYPVLTFKTTKAGRFWAVAYAYSERMSTFVAECDAQSWVRSGLDRMSDEDRSAFSEEIFADELSGRGLIANKSAWVCLPVVRNDRWSVGRTVLIGDALHSAHPSIGSGTRVAMEDAIALAESLERAPDVLSGLEDFRRSRAPAKQKLVDAAEKSFTWYESIAARMDTLDPPALVFDFLMRTGRLSEDRLVAEYPAFMARHMDDWKRHCASEATAPARSVAPDLAAT